MDIKILGTGCQKCSALANLVNEVVKEMNVQAEVEKVEDIPQIVKYGVMTTPGLVVNGKVKLTGRLPSRDELKKIISEEQ
ncbi:MAG: TM0996/MTH895 family glutaredoxin-like protein [Desulfotomaculum sp.]|nr:TM0996/MTH895 family glutaredoxin-like protein [Desulfotomaculum sp.]